MWEGPSPQGSHTQWQNEEQNKKVQPFHFNLGGWQATHLQALCQTGLGTVRPESQFKFFLWPILPAPPSFRKSWSLINILCSKLHFLCVWWGKVVLFPFFFFLSVFLPGNSKSPFLIHYFLRTDHGYSTVDWKVQSPLSHNGLIIFFAKVATTTWSYISCGFGCKDGRGVRETFSEDFLILRDLLRN